MDKDDIKTVDGHYDYETNDGYILGMPFLRAFMILMDFQTNKIGFTTKNQNYLANIRVEKPEQDCIIPVDPEDMVDPTPVEPIDTKPDDKNTTVPIDVNPVEPIDDKDHNITDPVVEPIDTKPNDTKPEGKNTTTPTDPIDSGTGTDTKINDTSTLPVDPLKPIIPIVDDHENVIVIPHDYDHQDTDDDSNNLGLVAIIIIVTIFTLAGLFSCIYRKRKEKNKMFAKTTSVRDGSESLVSSKNSGSINRSGSTRLSVNDEEQS